MALVKDVPYPILVIRVKGYQWSYQQIRGLLAETDLGVRGEVGGMNGSFYRSRFF